MFAILIPEEDTGLRVQQVAYEQDQMILLVVTTAPTAACPVCHCPSTHIHSRYQRTLLDLPIAAHPVRLRLQVRRFFCRAAACPRRVFAERLPELTHPYGQRTSRLTMVLRQIGLALGGKAGARLAANLRLASSPDTLLRLIRQTPESLLTQAPRVIGIDDWVRPVPSKQASPPGDEGQNNNKGVAMF